MNAAWHLLQHGPVLTLQREMLPRVETAARQGDVPAEDVAMLTDRVLVGEGKLQRYGNSFAVEAGRLVPHPIEDPARVDERRASVGLPPMSEYVQFLQRMYNLPVASPPPAR